MSNDKWNTPLGVALSTDTNSGDGIHVSPPVIGDPATDAANEHGQQEHSDTCAIRCQKIILDEFGQHYSEDALRDEATREHIYTEGGGTHLEDTGKLLQDHGVSCHQEMNATAYHLAQELGQGHEVIIGVDSSELWDNPVLHTIKGWLGMTGADHAVLVSGIDTSDPDHTRVIITDPGTGHVASYPIEQFTEAWRASHFFMVATDDPAPASAYGMQNFNYAENHIQDLQHLNTEQLEGWMHNPPDPANWGDLAQYPDAPTWTTNEQNAFHPHIDGDMHPIPSEEFELHHPDPIEHPDDHLTHPIDEIGVVPEDAQPTGDELAGSDHDAHVDVDISDF